MAVVAKNDSVQIEAIEVGPFGTNTYIIQCQETRNSLVVDAPGDAGLVLRHLVNTNVKYILITHNHFDHLGALSELKTKLGVPVAVHAADAARLPLEPDLLIDQDDAIFWGKVSLKVLHTPGHTPGSLCFLIDKYLISGDTLFTGGPGKTATPSDFTQIVNSITKKLFALPDDIIVYPGHGDSTALKKEKEEFAIFSARPHRDELCGDVVWLSS